MEERKWDRSSVLSGPVSRDAFESALRSEENASVALHKPGSEVAMRDGTRYRVHSDGSWRRIGVDNAE